eukprot:9057853-Pyramimonas_sp.AAC.1
MCCACGGGEGGNSTARSAPLYCPHMRSSASWGPLEAPCGRRHAHDARGAFGAFPSPPTTSQIPTSRCSHGKYCPAWSVDHTDRAGRCKVGSSDCDRVGFGPLDPCSHEVVRPPWHTLEPKSARAVLA